MAKIAVIVGSLRTPQVGSSVATWVVDIVKAQALPGLEFETVAIKDFNLPVFDEPVMPAMVSAENPLVHEHSKKWSATIASYQGYIFVIPEYNGGLAGGTKNALDYLFHEWPGKPLAIVSYGIEGGVRATEQLLYATEKIMKVKVVEPRINLPFTPVDIGGTVSGTLGEQSQKDWVENGKKDEIIKALGEIKAVLDAPKA